MNADAPKAPSPSLPPASAPAAAAPAGARAHRRLASADLFAGGNQVEIEHGGQVYRLRLTSLGKLILTK